MKIEFTEGCTCFSLNVDGVETIDMKLEDAKDVIKKLIDKEKDIAILQSCMEDLIQNQGDYEDLGYCEECGDLITRYTVNL